MHKSKSLAAVLVAGLATGVTVVSVPEADAASFPSFRVWSQSNFNGQVKNLDTTKNWQDVGFAGKSVINDFSTSVCGYSYSDGSVKYEFGAHKKYSYIGAPFNSRVTLDLIGPC
jgi:hypothetical protein